MFVNVFCQISCYEYFQVCEETRTVVMESQRSIEMLKLSGLRTRTDDVAADDLVLQLIERPLASEEEL